MRKIKPNQIFMDEFDNVYLVIGQNWVAKHFNVQTGNIIRIIHQDQLRALYFVGVI
jgi:hypothetical protein